MIAVSSTVHRVIAYLCVVMFATLEAFFPYTPPVAAPPSGRSQSSPLAQYVVSRAAAATRTFPVSRPYRHEDSSMRFAAPFLWASKVEAPSRCLVTDVSSDRSRGQEADLDARAPGTWWNSPFVKPHSC